MSPPPGTFGICPTHGALWNPEVEALLWDNHPFCCPKLFCASENIDTMPWDRGAQEDGPSYDMTDIPLKGQDEGTIPVYNTCDEVLTHFSIHGVGD